MYTASWCTLLIFSSFVSSLPVQLSGRRALAERDVQKKGIVLPFRRNRRVGRRAFQEVLAGSIGLGDYADMYYSVSAQVGNTTTALSLDTGSSDLWVMSDACRTESCTKSTSTAYSTSSFSPIGATVNLTYGDSTTGTYAAGPVGLDAVTLAGLMMPNQVLAAINDTDNSAVSGGSAGIMGLGFPAESSVQTAVINAKFDNPRTTDDFVSNIATYGPLVTRLVMTGVINEPMFAITLQRDTIDVGGNGQLTIGQLPEGVLNSSITWVPVRLYSPENGGLSPPAFASQEVYPLRWEVPLDNVFLDNKQLAGSTQQPNGVSSPGLSALIDTGNSIVRGPQDVVHNILSTVSPAYAANSNSKATFPCATPHTLAFQIGGQTFPIDPRDFPVQAQAGNTSTCVASNIVATDAPAHGALFSWSLGDPFLKSNLVVFYYGNLTHPSVDPPRIGFMSMVPHNASAALQTAVSSAQQNGGVFASTVQAAPTASSIVDLGVSTKAPTPYDKTSQDRTLAHSSPSGTAPRSTLSRFWYIAVVALSLLSRHAV
ncbi:acid protease [Amylocystis lapponica]|nr:acid protease [Amylocystis lapponica]